MNNYTFQYQGTELELFKSAINWKRYIKKLITPYLRGDVLEVGAGIGNNTLLLSEAVFNSWTCLDPDKDHIKQIEQAKKEYKLSQRTKTVLGKIIDITNTPAYDVILYLDVLEHIKADSQELHASLIRLKPGGDLIVLSPAHQFLYSPFDKKIGHYRRYNKKILAALTPSNTMMLEKKYIDSVGFFASLANRFILKSSIPSYSQLRLWDKVMVRLSMSLDPLVSYNFGKSIFVVWRKLN